MAKTFDQVISEMVTAVNTNLGQQDTRTGTVLREGFLAPVADQLSQAYSRTDQVEANQAIANPNAISSAAMERIATNFGLARFPGSPSSGSVRFMRFQAPPSPISIPSGTLVSVSGIGDALAFATLGTTSLTALSDQDPVTGAYFVDVPAQCIINGASGNVVAASIAFQSVPGIDEVTNLSDFSGGADVQSNEQLATIISARSQGNLGTAGGYTSLIMNNFDVSALALIGPTDADAQRAQFGGELDISVLTSDNVQSIETPSSITTVFYPSFLPLLSVDSVTGLDLTSTPQLLVSGTDYDIVLDNYSPLSRSGTEKSRINFHVTSFSVLPNSVFTVMYRNCQLIRVIQAFIEDKQYAVIGANPLVKLATEVIVNVGANIHIIPGYDPVTVQESAVKAVEAYFDALLLGVTAHESDVIVAMSVTGVDSVDSDTVQMALASDPFTYLQDIPIDKLSYLRTGPATVNITVS